MNDFIYIEENAVSDEYCDELISCIENSITLAENNKLEGTLIHSKNETALKYRSDIQINYETILNEEDLNNLRTFVANHTLRYIDRYFSLHQLGIEGMFDSGAKFQKTKPEGGFHTWHAECAKWLNNHKRILTWTLYLNTIEEGGATEFLYQHKQIPSTKGTLVIFPSYFTHTHRGNPPYSKDKYIATGWVSFASDEEKEDMDPKVFLEQYIKHKE